MASAAKKLAHARDYAGIAQRYATAVVSGKIVSCKWVRLACKRHIADLRRAREGGWNFVFDRWHAGDVCDFAEKLPHIEGKWETPTITLEPWQIFCLSVVFGWRRRSDGGRRFSKAYLEIGRKNAKSTLAAVVTLYCFTCEQEPAPYIFIGATLKVFHPCKKMVEKTPALQDAFGLKVWARSITEPGGGYIQTINSKGSTQDGHNPALAVLDELHAHKDRALYDVIDSAFGARRNPLLWIITTAGFDADGVCYEQRTYLTQVLEGLVEGDHYFGIIYTLDEGDDPYDPKVWIKANPNLGVSVQLTNMQTAASEAYAQPGKASEFLTKRLNVWTSAKAGHINVSKWKACDGPVDLEALRGVPCWGGIDLGATSDLTSFRLVWWVDGRLKTWGLRYLPEAAANERASKSNSPFKRWMSREFMGRPLLTVTPGDVTDYPWMEKDIRWAMATFKVQAIGFDKWNSQDLVNRLIEDGAPMVEVRQGVASLNGPMKEVDRCYLGGNLDHGGDEALNWCASNVVARRDENDNIAPSKKLSAEKIDDYAALLNAVAVSLKEPVKKPSIYETQRGLTVL
jgi:phage terminase large subunit-like protein